MVRAYFRFYADLDYFLPPGRQRVTFAHDFEGRVSVKDMIESLGVPHPEVSLIVANGAPVDFGYLVAADDRFAVYPAFRTLSLPPELLVTPPPPAPRFVLDVHLGRLAAFLRTLGFDTLYPDNYDDGHLAEISAAEDRILLTRDRGLLKRSMVIYGYCLRSTDPRQQVSEVLRRFNLYGQIAPFERCAHCNSLLESVDKEAIADRLQPETREAFDNFRQCTGCGRLYWQGSHYERMEQFIERLRRRGR